VIWATIRAAIYIGLGVAEVAGDVYSAGKKLARKLKPSEPKSTSNPLTFKDVQHIQDQIRRGARPAIPPPPKGTKP
jgi:hypothetical protein